jgi:hypothetical protein
METLTSGHSSRRESMMNSIPCGYCAQFGSVPYAITPADRIANPIRANGKITLTKITNRAAGCECGFPAVFSVHRCAV